jgi:hypothetical protein
MRTEAARKQSVAVGDVYEHAWTSARHAETARHQVGPEVEVRGGIAGDDRLAGGA